MRYEYRHRNDRRATASPFLAAALALLAACNACAGDQPAGAAASAAAPAVQAPRKPLPDDLAPRVWDWLEQRVDRELDVIARCAQLTPQQAEPVARAAEICLHRLAADFAQQPQALQQSGALFVRVAGRFQKTRINSLVVDRLSAAVAPELSDDQRAAYRQENASRTQFWAQANVAAMVVLLDGQLHLSPTEREAVSQCLSQRWQDAAHYDLASYLAHPRCVPVQLPELLEDVLDPSQKRVWITLHPVDYWRSIDGDRRSPAANDGEWLEQMLLQSTLAMDAFKQGLEGQRDALLRQVEAVCDLAPDQRDELRLAGQGDVKRFIDRVETLRDQLRAKASDPGRWVRADHDRLLPLQQTLSDGIFADGSLFEKVLAHRLLPDQVALWQQTQQRRAVADHAAQLRLLVATLDRQLPMLQPQRLKLLELLERQTRPMPIDTAYVQYGLIYQAAAISRDQLWAILDREQLEAVERVFRQNQSAEIFLRQNGLLPTAEFQDGEDD